MNERDESSPAPGSVAGDASPEGAWSLAANGHAGELVFERAGDALAGRVRHDATGAWEPLEGVSYVAGTLVFRRPSAGQVYVGTLVGGALRGAFTDAGGGAYAWTASPPDAELLGVWSLVGDGRTAELVFERSGDALVGRLRRDPNAAWEPLEGISYVARTLVFRCSSAGQIYAGMTSHGALRGAFTDAGGGAHAWAASRPGVAPVHAPVGTDTAPLLGTWSLVGNGYRGQLVLERSGDALAGRVWYDAIGVWEELEALSVRAGGLVFTRPGPAQVYTGALSDGALHGTFTDDGGGTYAWAASRSPA